MKEFDPSGNTAVFTCIHVIKNAAPILLISHDDDEWWQFLCGEAGHDDQDAMIVALDEIVTLDESVHEVADMPTGYKATRATRKVSWEYSPTSDSK